MEEKYFVRHDGDKLAGFLSTTDPKVHTGGMIEVKDKIRFESIRDNQTQYEVVNDTVVVKKLP